MKKLNLFLGVFMVMFSSAVQAQETMDSVTMELGCACNESSNQPSSVNYNSGMKVLETGRQMAIIDKTVVRGSCWDFVNEVFKRAGSGASKSVVFRSKKNGPYAKADMVKPGDWIYHVNLAYKNIDHSAIFVCWKDFAKRIAVTLSYAGMNRNQPGKYGTYNLSKIYSIFRPVIAEGLKSKP